jgi:ABC-type sugar transport system ATPase subunit
MARVQLRNVEKRFGANPIVRGVSLVVENGELLVLVGPSGCGKSTLLRLVAGLEEPDAGEVHIGERRVDGLAPRDRDVAMVFQSYALYPHLTVRENLAFPLKLRGRPRAEIDAAVDEAARMLELEPLLGRRPKELSGGQRQRVAMGRAVVRHPAVFLFDEPLSNLDAALRNQMRVEIRQLHRRLGATTIYVTHDQVEAMTLADRVAVLEKGVLQQVATPKELFELPANRFVGGFIGSPAMNFLRARVEGATLTGEGFTLPSDGTKRAEGTSVDVGIRPHDLRIASNGEAGGLAAKVELLEPLGWETHVHLRVGGAPVVVVAPSATLDGVGEGSSVSLAPARVHVFDAQSGVALR